jgi:hypothetical protein
MTDKQVIETSAILRNAIFIFTGPHYTITVTFFIHDKRVQVQVNDTQGTIKYFDFKSTRKALDTSAASFAAKALQNWKKEIVTAFRYRRK